METEIRGFVEKILDNRLTEKYLTNRIKLMNSLRPAISSIEDGVFGFTVGEVFGAYLTLSTGVLDRLPSEEEKKEFKTIIADRTPRAHEHRSRF